MTSAGPSEQSFDASKLFRRGGTSSDAASDAAKRATLTQPHRRIWQELRRLARTPDELSTDLGWVLNTTRARCSALRKAGWIKATGERRRTAAGKFADVLIALLEPEEPTTTAP